MKTLLALACVLGLLGAIPAHAAGLKDVLGREVPIAQGRPAVVLYANRDTQDDLRENAYKFAYGLRDAHPIVVVRVDLRGVPGLFKGKARKEIARCYRESLEKMRELFREKGQQPPADLESSLFMVADYHGAPHEVLGMKKGFDQVIAEAVGPTGQGLARGPFPQAAPSLGRAIGAEETGRGRSAADTPTTRPHP